MKELKVVGVDELHNTIRDFIIESNTIIGDYEDMKSLILNMVKAGYMFNMDRDRLRDAMEDITFLLCPDDDANKDRVERGLEYDDDSDSDIEDIGNTSELC
jgi:GTPase SAR1 family protein